MSVGRNFKLPYLQTSLLPSSPTLGLFSFGSTVADANLQQHQSSYSDPLAKADRLSYCTRSTCCCHSTTVWYVGDQAVGKSYLVQTLGYGIRLSGDVGTCTYAPLKLRVKTNLHPEITINRMQLMLHRRKSLYQHN